MYIVLCLNFNPLIENGRFVNKKGNEKKKLETLANRHINKNESKMSTGVSKMFTNRAYLITLN